MTEFFGITLLIILAAISPGPDFAMVVKNALLGSRKRAVFTALGVSSSLLIHSTYCILGVAIMISESLLMFSIVKYIGAAYLIYIGIKSLCARDSVLKVESKTIKNVGSASQGFLQGFLCNLLNPKGIMFILAFFTVVIDPDFSLTKKLFYGLEISLIHFIWFSCLALMITHPQVKKRLHIVQHYLEKIMGVVLIAFGVRIAMLSHVIGT